MAKLTYKGEEREVKFTNSVLVAIEADGIELSGMGETKHPVTDLLKIGYFLLRIKEPFADVLDDLPSIKEIAEAMAELNAALQPGESDGDG
jgi:hypothetical protein